VWAIRDGALHVYPGNYQEYLARRQVEMAAQREEAERARRIERLRRQRAEAERRGREQERTGDEMEALEARIARLERELGELEHALAQASAEANLDRVRALDVEYKVVQADLEQSIAEWTALGEAVE
jgi:ATPase subunit of ABC transporter with duplicated ATPase domains